MLKSKVKLWRPAGHVTLSSFLIKARAQKSNFEGLLAMSHCPGSDWNEPTKSQTLQACWPCHVVQALIESILQKSNFEGPLAMSHCPGSDWNRDQKSNFAGLLAMSRCPGSDWNERQMLRCEGSGANCAARIARQVFHHQPLSLPLIPVNENSASSTLYPWAKRQAACKLTGMYVAHTCARWPPSPCCCRLLMQHKPWSMGHN